MPIIVKSKLGKLKTFGETVRLLREKQGLLLRELAAALSIDSSIISKIECGTRKPTKVQVNAFCDYFAEQKNELMIAWLSDKLAFELENEELALQAMQVAEEKVLYKKSQKEGLNQIIDSIKGFFNNDGRVSKAWIFGSYARSQANQKSDIDIMVRFKSDRKISLFDLADIAYLLSDYLKIKVDLVEEGCLASFAAEYAENEKILVYEE